MARCGLIGHKCQGTPSEVRSYVAWGKPVWEHQKASPKSKSTAIRDQSYGGRFRARTLGSLMAQRGGVDAWDGSRTGWLCLPFDLEAPSGVPSGFLCPLVFAVDPTIAQSGSKVILNIGNLPVRKRKGARGPVSKDHRKRPYSGSLRPIFMSREKTQIGITISAPSRKYSIAQCTASKPI